MFESTTVKKVAANTVYQIIGKVISLLITVLATILVTRAYGREGYGEFSLMQTWPALFFVIVDFGLNAIATRELSKDRSKIAAYLGNILLFRIVFSLVLIGLLGLVVNFAPAFAEYSSALKVGIFLSLFLLLTQALFTTTNIIFQVDLRYDLSTIGYLVGYGFILASILGLAYFKAPVMWVSFAYVLGGVVTFALNAVFLKNMGVSLKPSYDPVLMKSLFYNSLPLGLMFVFSQVSFKADSIMLSVLPVPKSMNLTGTEAVAIYNLPYKVFEVALVVPTFFMNSVYPIMIRHMQESRQKLLDTLQKSLLALTVVGLLGSILGFVFAKPVIFLLGGAEFGQSVLVLQILMSGLLLYFLTQPISWLIVTLNKQNYLPWIYLVSAVFNVVANYFFIPIHSVYASAVITHVSELIILILLTLFAIRAWNRSNG